MGLGVFAVFFSMDNGENKGFEPSGTTFGQRSKDYVGVSWPEMFLHVKNGLECVGIVPTTFVVVEIVTHEIFVSRKRRHQDLGFLANLVVFHVVWKVRLLISIHCDTFLFSLRVCTTREDSERRKREEFVHVLIMGAS